MSVEKKQMPATDDQLATLKYRLQAFYSPSFDRDIVMALLFRLEQAEAKVASIEEQVVWGFYEEEHPVYAQGKAGHHELTEPITAKEANGLIDRIKKLQEALKDALGEWENNAYYKGEFLRQKHGDLEQIAEYQKLLNAKGE